MSHRLSLIPIFVDFFDKKDLKPKKTGLVTRRKIKNEYREKLNKKNASN